MTAIFFSLAAFVSTLGGGLFALRYRDHLHYLLSFTAGVLLAVVSFELLPEIFELAHEHALDPSWAMAALVAGFLFFHSGEKFILIHHAHESDYAAHRHPHVGMLSALALVGHSLLDGVGIGLAFQASTAVGLVVAIAVITHDCCDGLNTVGLMLTHRNPTPRAVAMLVLDALAPVIGAASTLLFQLPPVAVMVYLGFFAGFLLYIGVSDILPEAHSKAGPSTAIRLIGLTAFGAVLIYFVSRWA
ncbi:MAG: ZIP family metal transporter [Burkholderiales bacterium]|nr:ZIP family metal transporter [Burkholderiales bacterium]MDE2395644.1 ZIP family metal transporter [Burkholderiales bacterium]MDE2456660.1 ZIP family metal transporter [Burkholderiales bacterium]